MPKRKFPKFIYFLVCFLLIFEQSGFAQVAGELDISGHLALFRNSLIPDKFRPLHLRSLQYLPENNSFKLLLDKGDQLPQKNSRGHFPTSAEGDTFRQSYGEATQRKVSPSGPKESVPLDETKLKDETKVLLNYFFIGLTLPNSSFWVNLRPDAEDNIIDDYLAKTDVGKILLEADLQLKKDTAKFTSPETPEGKLYWDKLYQKAGELLGNENITIPTLTRPWIVPGEIIIRETAGEASALSERKRVEVPPSAYIYKATLKVMLESDYLSSKSRGHFPSGLSGNSLKESVPYAQYQFKDDRLKQLNEYSSQLIRELIIPKLTKDINTSKRYAPLRQVYYSLILAQWFKARHATAAGDTFPRHQGLSPQGTVPDAASALINSRNLTNLISQQPWSKTTYFQAYQKSFKDGEYNIQQPAYTPTGQVIRSYFSGGLSLGGIPFSSVSPTSGSPIKIVTDSTSLFETVGDKGISPLTDNNMPVLAVIGNGMNPSDTNITITEGLPSSQASPAERPSPSGASSFAPIAQKLVIGIQASSSAIGVMQVDEFNKFMSKYELDKIGTSNQFKLASWRISAYDLGEDGPVVAIERKFNQILINPRAFGHETEDRILYLVLQAAVQIEIKEGSNYYLKGIYEKLAEVSVFRGMAVRSVIKDLMKKSRFTFQQSLNVKAPIPMISIPGLGKPIITNDVKKELLQSLFGVFGTEKGDFERIDLVLANFEEEIDKAIKEEKRKFFPRLGHSGWEVLARIRGDSRHSFNEQPFIEALRKNKILVELIFDQWSQFFRYDDVLRSISNRVGFGDLVKDKLSEFRRTGQQQVITIGVIGAASGQEPITAVAYFSRQIPKILLEQLRPGEDIEKAITVKVDVMSYSNKVYDRVKNNQIIFPKIVIDNAGFTDKEKADYFKEVYVVEELKGYKRSDRMNSHLEFYDVDLADVSAGTTPNLVGNLDILFVHHVLQYVPLGLESRNALSHYLDSLLKSGGILSKIGEDKSVMKDILADKYFDYSNQHQDILYVKEKPPLATILREYKDGDFYAKREAMRTLLKINPKLFPLSSREELKTFLTKEKKRLESEENTRYWQEIIGYITQLLERLEKNEQKGTGNAAVSNLADTPASSAQEKPVSSPVGEINKIEGWSFDKGRLSFPDGTSIYNQHTRRSQLKISLEPLDLSKINADEDLEWVRALIIQWQKEAEEKKELPSKETAERILVGQEIGSPEKVNKEHTGFISKVFEYAPLIPFLLLFAALYYIGIYSFLNYSSKVDSPQQAAPNIYRYAGAPETKPFRIPQEEKSRQKWGVIPLADNFTKPRGEGSIIKKMESDSNFNNPQIAEIVSGREYLLEREHLFSGLYNMLGNKGEFYVKEIKAAGVETDNSKVIKLKVKIPALNKGESIPVFSLLGRVIRNIEGQEGALELGDDGISLRALKKTKATFVTYDLLRVVERDRHNYISSDMRETPQLAKEFQILKTNPHLREIKDKLDSAKDAPFEEKIEAVRDIIRNNFIYNKYFDSELASGTYFDWLADTLAEGEKFRGECDTTSSFVWLMFRYLGVDALYAEGYSLGGTNAILKYPGHALILIHDKDFGWRPFDATEFMQEEIRYIGKFVQKESKPFLEKKTAKTEPEKVNKAEKPTKSVFQEAQLAVFKMLGYKEGLKDIVENKKVVDKTRIDALKELRKLKADKQLYDIASKEENSLISLDTTVDDILEVGGGWRLADNALELLRKCDNSSSRYREMVEDKKAYIWARIRALNKLEYSPAEFVDFDRAELIKLEPFFEEFIKKYSGKESVLYSNDETFLKEMVNALKILESEPWSKELKKEAERILEAKELWREKLKKKLAIKTPFFYQSVLHITLKGQSLSLLAFYYYGDRNQYSQIADANEYGLLSEEKNGQTPIGPPGWKIFIPEAKVVEHQVKKGDSIKSLVRQYYGENKGKSYGKRFSPARRIIGYNGLNLPVRLIPGGIMRIPMSTSEWERLQKKTPAEKGKGPNLPKSSGSPLAEEKGTVSNLPDTAASPAQQEPASLAAEVTVELTETYRPITQGEKEAALNKYAQMSEADFSMPIRLNSNNAGALEDGAIFHGTNREFEQFILSPKDMEYTMGLGFYFTDNTEQAQKYALRRTQQKITGNPQVVAARLIRSKLLDCRNNVPDEVINAWLKYLESLSLDWARVALRDRIFTYIRYRRHNKKPILLRQGGGSKETGVDGWFDGITQGFDFRIFILSLGYDGVIGMEGGEGRGDEAVGNHVSIVIFDPENIITYEMLNNFKESRKKNLQSVSSVNSPIILNKDKKGGIDFRALPAVSSPINPAMLKLSPIEINRLSNLNLDAEWAEIENMLKAGIIPSNQRLKEYVASSCLRQALGRQMGKVLGCIANILRMEEERVTETEPELEDMLVLIESGKPENELQLSLAQIQILPREPQLVTP
ncbi:MAG: transglutaminase domain-containing protein [Candidatus Omnitrophota bacterium]|nr:transglutaminase domain-containing protein [Candidatus Omnitrophota bacterium]